MFALRCPVACETCNLLDPAIRCNNDFLKLSTAPAYIPGQMSAVLAGVKRENEHRFGVEVLSQSPWVLQVIINLSKYLLIYT